MSNQDRTSLQVRGEICLRKADELRYVKAYDSTVLQNKDLDNELRTETTAQGQGFKREPSYHPEPEPEGHLFSISKNKG